MLIYISISFFFLTVIVNLLSTIRQLETYDVLEVPNRAAFNRRRFKLFNKNNWAAFVDIDNMHSANEKYGYEVVNEKLRNSFGVLRNSEWKLFQYYGGDEFVIICNKKEIEYPVQRLIDALRKNGLTCTMVVGEISQLDKLKDEVQLQKSNGNRDSVTYL